MGIERELRVAIVGCGAVTELAHLPAAQCVRDCRITLLVDPNRARRELLARSFNVDRTAADVASFADCFDAAIVAVPHALHAPITCELAALGKSVLVEKPMAHTAGECGATGTVELSRTRRLRNAAIIEMEGATLEVALAANHVKMALADQPYLVGGPVAHLDHPDLNQDYLTSIADQLRDWINAIRKKRPPVVDARSALESVQLIETCYRHRQPLVLEWDDVSVPVV